MRFVRPVLLILLLVAGSPSPPAARAQEGGPLTPQVDAPQFGLEQNYPNPVNPETWIPFTLGEPLFESRDSAVVSMRIFNVLRQLVAVPEAVDHPAGEGVRVLNLTYTAPGRHIAYWDGTDVNGRRVPSGVYYCQLVVDDQPQPQTRKVIVLNPRRRRSIIPWF